MGAGAPFLGVGVTGHVFAGHRLALQNATAQPTAPAVRRGGLAAGQRPDQPSGHPLARQAEHRAGRARPGGLT